MFDNVIEATKEQILGHFPQTSEFIPFEKILQSEFIEPAYKHYFKAELNRWMFEFRQIFHNLRNFDLSRNDAQQTLERLYNLLPNLARFDIEDFEEAVFSGVKLRCHYLLRPQNTLAYFVFGNSLNKSVAEITLLLDYFYDYKYLISALTNRLQTIAEKASNPFVSIFEFKQWVANTDNENLSFSTFEKILELFEPMFEFFNNGNFELETSRIPTVALIYFFEDKRQEALANFFETLAETKETLTVVELFDSISQCFASKSRDLNSNPDMQNAESKQAFNAITFDSISPFIFSLPDEIPTPKSENFNSDSYLNVGEQSAISSHNEKERIATMLEKFENRPNVSQTEETATQNSREFHEAETQIGFENTLSRIIPFEKRAKFIEELFHSFEEVYEKLLAELDGADSFEEAIFYANQYFTNSGVPNDSPLAQEFFSFVQMKFGN